jgi:hypothetical protein
MKKSVQNYGTSQEMLYTICMAAWKLCNQYLAQFAALKPYYTADFITASKQSILNAKELPSSLQTITDRKAAHIALVASGRQVQANWQLLKLYIIKAYDKDVVKARLEAAGTTFYDKSSIGNWSSVRSLIDAANIFIAANMDTLTANQNMPAGFQSRFREDSDNCVRCSGIFFGSNLEKEMATSIKIDANNAIYGSMIEMLKDGQQIFKNDATIKRQFTFNRLISMYKGEGFASLRGHIVNNLNQPVEGVTVTSADKKYSATTNAKGQYRLNRVAAGAYSFIITSPGYTPVEHLITFTSGTACIANFELANTMKKVA